MSRVKNGAREATPGTICLIGIGQSLRGDDAAGLEAVRLWRQQHQVNDRHSNVRVELAEVPGIGLLSLVEGNEFVILVDAVHSQTRPGTIHQLHPDQLDSFGQGAASAHGWGVAETLVLGQKLMPSKMPINLILIGIEAGDLSLGEKLSPEVEQALPGVVNLIERLITDR